MFCQKCGSNNPDNAVVCGFCGNQLAPGIQQPPYGQQQQQPFAQQQPFGQQQQPFAQQQPPFGQQQQQPFGQQSFGQQSFQGQNGQPFVSQSFGQQTIGGQPYGQQQESAFAQQLRQSFDPNAIMSVPFVKRCNWVGLGAGIFCLIATFIPYYSFGVFGTLNTFQCGVLQGIIYLVFSLAALAMSIFGIHIGVAASGGAMMIWHIIATIINSTAAQGLGRFTVGYVFFWIGSIALIVGGVIFLLLRNNKIPNPFK